MSFELDLTFICRLTVLENSRMMKKIKQKKKHRILNKLNLELVIQNTSYYYLKCFRN